MRVIYVLGCLVASVMLSQARYISTDMKRYVGTGLFLGSMNGLSPNNTYSDPEITTASGNDVAVESSDTVEASDAAPTIVLATDAPKSARILSEVSAEHTKIHKTDSSINSDQSESSAGTTEPSSISETESTSSSRIDSETVESSSTTGSNADINSVAAVDRITDGQIEEQISSGLLKTTMATKSVFDSVKAAGTESAGITGGKIEGEVSSDLLKTTIATNTVADIELDGTTSSIIETESTSSSLKDSEMVESSNTAGLKSNTDINSVAAAETESAGIAGGKIEGESSSGLLETTIETNTAADIELAGTTESSDGTLEPSSITETESTSPSYIDSETVESSSTTGSNSDIDSVTAAGTESAGIAGGQIEGTAYSPSVTGMNSEFSADIDSVESVGTESTEIEGGDADSTLLETTVGTDTVTEGQLKGRIESSTTRNMNSKPTEKAVADDALTFSGGGVGTGKLITNDKNSATGTASKDNLIKEESDTTTDGEVGVDALLGLPETTIGPVIVTKVETERPSVPVAKLVPSIENLNEIDSSTSVVSDAKLSPGRRLDSKTSSVGSKLPIENEVHAKEAVAGEGKLSASGITVNYLEPVEVIEEEFIAAKSPLGVFKLAPVNEVAEEAIGDNEAILIYKLEPADIAEEQKNF